MFLFRYNCRVFLYFYNCNCYIVIFILTQTCFRITETMLVDFLKTKSTNIPPFTSYLNERLEGLDPHHRRLAEGRLMQILDQVELEQEQSRASFLPPTFNPQEQSLRDHGPPRHGPSWNQYLQASSWQGWQPHPNQWQPHTGSQPTVWGSQNAAWVQSEYPTHSKSVPAVVTATTTGTPAWPISPISTAAGRLTTDDGETLTALDTSCGNAMDDSLTLMGNTSFSTLLLSAADNASTHKKA